MTDLIRLVIPAEEDFRPIVHLVAGGLGARLELPYDDLEDLQVALGALLVLRDDADEMVVELRVGQSVVHAAVGPFPPEALRGLDEDGAGELGLRQVLEAVCDSFEREERADGAWVELTRRAPAAAGSAAGRAAGARPEDTPAGGGGVKEG